MSLTRRSTTERRDSRASDIDDHIVPLLQQEEQTQHDQHAQVVPIQTAPAAEGVPLSTSAPAALSSARTYSSHLLIEAAIAQYPFVTGQPVRQAPAADTDGQGGLVFVPDLPNAQQLWQAQKMLMVAWLATSIMSLIIFLPFYITTGLFLGAEIAAVLGIVATSVYLCQRNATTGLELEKQIKLAATCSMAAFCLDMLTAFLDLVIGWGIDCRGDDICLSVLNYILVFGLYLSWHAYLSLSVNTRAKSMLPLLNPVSSGVVHL